MRLIIYKSCFRFNKVKQNNNLIFGPNITFDINNMLYAKCSQRFWIDLINVYLNVLIIWTLKFWSNANKTV